MTIDEITTREPEFRTPDEKFFLVMYLKYKIPFFKSFQKEVISLICDKLEHREFKTKTTSTCYLYINIIYSNEKR